MIKLQATTSAPESYVGFEPVIKKIDFNQRGKITLHFQDGRILMAPLSRFPSIRRLTDIQRKKHTITAENVIIFQDCDEVYHLQDFLGLPEDYIVKP